MDLFETETLHDDFKYILDGIGKKIEIHRANTSPLNTLAAVTNFNVKEGYDDKKLTTLESIQKGDIVHCDSITYLILSEINGDRYGKYRGIMRHCNYNLKMQYNTEIISIPAIITNQSGGIDTDKYMILPDGQYQIIIQSNDINKTIQRDKRFIFFGMAWKVTFVDQSQNGLLILTVEETEFNANDNKELEIADYVEYNYELIVEPTSISIQEGQTGQINAELLLNGVPQQESNFTYLSSDESIAIVNETGLITGVSAGTITITVSAKGQTQIVNVEVSAIPQDNFTAEIVGEDSIINNSTKTYTAIFKNNGVEITDMIATVTSSNTSLATIVTFSGNTFDVKADRTNKGYVTINVVSSEISIAASKEIQIKGLW